MITITIQSILAYNQQEPIEVKAHYLNDFEVVEDILAELREIKWLQPGLKN